MAPSPPKYFKCCKLLKIDYSIQLELDNWPTCIIADRCSKNLSASNKLTTLLELLSLSLYCTIHTADKSIKRPTNSKTMNVPEVSEFLPALQSILMHFKLSRRNTVMLNDALEGLDMKTVHMLFFPTRTSYILPECKHTVVNLVPICDVIATPNLKLEENTAFIFQKV